MKKSVWELFYFFNFFSKKKILVFIIFSVSLALLDLSGIISVGVFASVLIQGGESKVVSILKEIIQLKELSDRQYILLFGVVLVCVYFIKTTTIVVMR